VTKQSGRCDQGDPPCTEHLTFRSPHHDCRRLILGIIAIAQQMVVLDVTIVNIALAAAQQDLGFSDDTIRLAVPCLSGA
jgi:hypothetical protein